MKTELKKVLENHCGDASPNVCWALASFEEAWWAENRSTVKKEQDQELHEQTMAVKARRGGLSPRLIEECVRK